VIYGIEVITNRNNKVFEIQGVSWDNTENEKPDGGYLST